MERHYLGENNMWCVKRFKLFVQVKQERIIFAQHSRFMRSHLRLD